MEGVHGRRVGHEVLLRRGDDHVDEAGGRAGVVPGRRSKYKQPGNQQMKSSLMTSIARREGTRGAAGGRAGSSSPMSRELQPSEELQPNDET